MIPNEAEEQDLDGYPKVAAFYGQSHTPAFYQRFGYVASRLLLHKQNQLQSLEQELFQIDNPMLLKTRSNSAHWT